MFYNEFAEAMTSETAMRTINVTREKLKPAHSGSCSNPPLPRILKEGFLRVHPGGKTKADSLTKSIANNILAEKSDKRGTSLKTAQCGHSNSKNDAGSWEQSPRFWCSFLSQGKQQTPKRKPALPSVPRGPLTDPHANTP